MCSNVTDATIQVVAHWFQGGWLRLAGDRSRFRSLAGARSFSGLVPSLNASGASGRHGRPTRRGDAVLREAIFIAADHARRIDPTLAARSQRLMVSAGKHHNSALCHIATTLLTRIVACWRRGERYVIRDCDGRPVSARRGPKHRRRALQCPRRGPPSATGPSRGLAQGDGPPPSGVAERSGACPSPDYATATRRGLKSVSPDPPKKRARAAALGCSAVAGTMGFDESRTSHREHPFDASNERPRPDRHRLRRPDPLR